MVRYDDIIFFSKVVHCLIIMFICTYTRRLTDGQFHIVKEMTEAKCKPKKILVHLNKDKDTTFKATSSKRINNAKIKIKK